MFLLAELASRPNRPRLHRMSSLPILDRDKKRRSIKGKILKDFRKVTFPSRMRKNRHLLSINLNLILINAA